MTQPANRRLVTEATLPAGVEEALSAPGPAAVLDAAMVNDRTSTAVEESSTIGGEMIGAGTWTLGTGWAGTAATGFTKTGATADPLTWTPTAALTAGTYLVEWKWEGDAGQSADQWVYGAYDVTLGNGSAGIVYQGVAFTYSRAIKVTASGPLVFQPWPYEGAHNFGGRIYDVSIRPVTTAAAIPFGWKTSTGTRGGELRLGSATTPNVYLGIDAGKWNYSGYRNAAVGDYSMANNVTGFCNAALGYEALRDNVNGTRNVGVGYRALAENLSGDRNVGIGPFALTRNATGQRNVAIGVDVLWRSTVGNDNVGIGYLTQTELRSGESNIAIGRYAMRHTHGASNGGTQHNVAIGREALGYVTGSGNVAVGRRALASMSSRDGMVAIGDYALETTTTQRSHAVGYAALRYATGERNTAFGWQAGRGVSGSSTGTRNVFLGDDAGNAFTTGSQNTVVGPSAGITSVTSGSGNILLGFAAEVTNGASNQMSLGNTLYGDLANKRIGIGVLANIGAHLHIKAGVATANGAPLKFSAGTLLTTPENGTVEYDGTKFYVTLAGTRREIALV